MARVTIKGIQTIKKRLADGSPVEHHYHRKTRTKLTGEYGSVEFLLQMQKLEGAKPKTGGNRIPGSFGALIVAYKKAPEYTQRSKKTKSDYLRYLTKLDDLWGDLPVAELVRADIFDLRDKFVATPRSANYIVQVLRLLLTFAVDHGWRADNPALRPKLLKTGDGHRPWEEHEIQAFRDTWKPETVERRAFELLLNTGQRGEDICPMVRTHYRAGLISVAQEKTGNRVEIPASQDLKAVLDPWMTANKGMMMVTGQRGRGITIDYFRHVMAAAYAKAELPDDITTHGLRFAAAVRLYELGVSEEGVADIVGHATMQMTRHYLRKKRRTRLSIDTLDLATAKTRREENE